MRLSLDSIADADGTPENPVPTTVLSAVAAKRHRRSFLRAIGYAGITIGALALVGPFGGRTRLAWAENGPGGLTGHDDCAGINYTPTADTHGIYVTAPPACYGGSYRGWNWCSSAGWHRGSWARSADNKWCWHMSPRSDVCGSPARNAWRWATGDGRLWRCSDGNSVVFRMSDNKKYGPYLTICRARV